MLFGNKMANTILEQTGGTYTQIGDYLLPDLELPEEEKEASLLAYGDSDICAILNSPAKCFTPTCSQAVS